MLQGGAKNVVAAPLLLFLAACIDEAKPTSDSFNPAPLDGMGVLEGYVVDSALNPIPGAQVGIVSLALLANTTDAGYFRFDAVAPGRYDLAAQKLGYLSAATSVDVQEGERVTRTITLEVLPTTKPYFEVVIERGSFGCGIAYRPQQQGIVGASVCGAITAYGGENQIDRFLIFWDLVGPYPGWNGAAYEMEWTTTQALGSGLWVRFETDGCAGSLESQFTSLRGKSPLREVQSASVVAEKLAKNAESGCASAERCSEEGCVLQSRVFPHSEVLGESYPADIGVTIQQPFTQYFSQFFFTEPSPDYSALADA